MMVEFMRRISQLSEKLSQLKSKGPGHDREIAYFQGALSECESLSYFYKEQMVKKGRILPEEKTKDQTTEVKNGGSNYRLD